MLTRDAEPVIGGTITIVIKFFDEQKIQHAVASPMPEWRDAEWSALRAKIEYTWGGELRARSVFQSTALTDIEVLKTAARQRSEKAGIQYAPPQFENYLSLIYRAGAADSAADPYKREQELAQVAELIIKTVSSWSDVEQSYLRPQDLDPGLRRTTQPVKFDAPNTDPNHVKQSHLHDVPLGVGVQSLWRYEGADGAGQRFIDIERGWKLSHKDLADKAGLARVQLIPGAGVISTGRVNIWHGTCVLGVVCAAHNGTDIIGMAPRLASMQVLSYVDAAHVANTADAVMHAAAKQIERDVAVVVGRAHPQATTVRSNVVMLIEAHALPERQHFYFPVEIYPETFDVITLATHAGITVIEPAGNGRVPDDVIDPQHRSAVDLDRMNAFIKPALAWKKPPRSLFRGAPNERPPAPRNGLSAFADSGAIMVACAEHAEDTPRDWTRSRVSNFGTRIDCFAAGEGVFTLDAGGGNGPDFSGTSSASVIIAGAALRLQGVALAHLGQPFAPAQLREALIDVDCSIPSIDASNDKIVLMPDLMKIAKKYIAGG